MVITKEMGVPLKTAVQNLKGDTDHAEVPGVGGHFVTLSGNEIPDGAKRIQEFGFKGKKYILYALMEPEGTNNE